MLANNKYSTEQKNEIIQKWLTGVYPSFSYFARNQGIPETTIEKWLKKATIVGIGESARTTSRRNLTQKMDAVFDWKQVPEEEQGAWLRSKGYTDDQLGLWEKEITMSNEAEALRDKRRIKELEQEVYLLNKDLHEKNKALADVSARLILQKKMEEFLKAKRDA